MNPYKDKEGHWTTKENAGGECKHGTGAGKQPKKLTDNDFDENMNLKSGKSWSNYFDENEKNALKMLEGTLNEEQYNALSKEQLKQYTSGNASIGDMKLAANIQLENNDAPQEENEIDYENITYPKGTSKEYTKTVNDNYKKALPILEKTGIKLSDFGGKNSDEGGYTDNSKEIMDKYVFKPFRNKYPNGNNEMWEKEYQPLYEAIDAVMDKNYNDWWIRNKQPQQEEKPNYKTIEDYNIGAEFGKQIKSGKADNLLNEIADNYLDNAIFSKGNYTDEQKKDMKKQFIAGAKHGVRVLQLDDLDENTALGLHNAIVDLRQAAKGDYLPGVVSFINNAGYKVDDFVNKLGYQRNKK